LGTRSSGLPSAAKTSRIAMPWVTTSTGRGPAAISSSAAITRAVWWRKDSPAGKAKSGSARRNAAKPSGSSAETSSKERSVQAPVSVSTSRSSSRAGSPSAAATIAAV